jgi:CubicO group peptidase (beta-lactamase class C family)
MTFRGLTPESTPGMPGVRFLPTGAEGASGNVRVEGIRAGQQTAADRFRASGALQLVDELVARQMRQDRTPGLALAVTARDGAMMVSTYGFADLRARVPLTPAHLFEIGSISKSFTAIALLQQRDAGRFDPRAPITTYLPWLKMSGAEGMTGHHLLTHTAGIPRDRDDIPSSVYQAAALRDVAAKPGSRFAYSNVGYQVLGHALAAIAGRPYPDVIRDAILRPLGMASSDPHIVHDTRLRLAVGYDDMYDDRPEHVSHPLMPATWLEYAAGDGSIVSTPEDMAAYARMILNGGRLSSSALISRESFALLTQKAVQTGDGAWYGYGLRIREVDGRTLVSHSGGMVGYAALLVADMTDGVAAVVMINGPGSPGILADFALSAARAVAKDSPLPPLPPADDPLHVPEAGDYAGTYTSPSGAAVRIIGENQRLWILHRGERLALERRGTDRFYANHPDFALFLLQFARDAKKQVTELSYGDWWLPGERYTGPRTFNSPEAWNAYAGHYRTTHAWFNNFRIVLRKGQLRLVCPDGREQLLVPVGEEFALEDKDSAERLRFDTIVNGSALRATLSGVPYYRSFTP